MSEEKKGDRMIEEEGKKGKEEDMKGKVGRPRKVEELAKERRGSMGCIEEFLKRKREGGEEEDKGGEERMLRRSKKMETLQGEGWWLEREELRRMFSEMGEKITDRMSKELEKIKLELLKKEEEWGVERKEMGEKIKMLEERMMELEAKLETKLGGTGKIGERENELEGINETMVVKMKGLGKKMEMKDREERRNNIVIRRLEGEGGTKEKVERIMEEIEANVEMEWIRKIRGKEGGVGEMVVVRLGSREQKRQVMEKKRKLKGRKERIEDDLTWEERKMKWKVEEIAEKERRKGNRVWTGYGKIRINEKWWKWDEEEGCLRDWKGERRGEEEEKGEGK